MHHQSNCAGYIVRRESREGVAFTILVDTELLPVCYEWDTIGPGIKGRICYGTDITRGILLLWARESALSHLVSSVLDQPRFSVRKPARPGWASSP